MEDHCWIKDVERGFEVVIKCDEMYRFGDDIEAAVDAIWAAEKMKRGDGLFNGTLFGVVEYDRRRVVGRWFEYKYYVAYREDAGLFGEVFLVPLGVSGVILGEDYLVFGRRSEKVMGYPGVWELAPSGAVDRSCVSENGKRVDYARLLLKELEEETGLTGEDIDEIEVIGFGRDVKGVSHEVCAVMRTGLSFDEMKARMRDVVNDEYDRFEVVRVKDAADFILSNERRVLPISAEMLRRVGVV